MSDWLSSVSGRALIGDPKPLACWCAKCHEEADRVMWHMILCPDCGNKRCPKATDHRHLCTKSNEPGQPGSAYR